MCLHVDHVHYLSSTNGAIFKPKQCVQDTKEIHSIVPSIEFIRHEESAINKGFDILWYRQQNFMYEVYVKTN